MRNLNSFARMRMPCSVDRVGPLPKFSTFAAGLKLGSSELVLTGAGEHRLRVPEHLGTHVLSPEQQVLLCSLQQPGVPPPRSSAGMPGRSRTARHARAAPRPVLHPLTQPPVCRSRCRPRKPQAKSPHPCAGAFPDGTTGIAALSRSRGQAGAGGEPLRVRGKPGKPGSVYTERWGLGVLDVPCAVSPGSTMQCKWASRCSPRHPMSPTGSGATGAGFAMGPLFTISNPTPCFLPRLPPYLGPSLWGRAVAAPSLGQWKVFMTFCLFCGCLAAGRGRAPRTNMSMDKQWGRSCRHRLPAGPVPTEPGVLASAGTPVLRPRLGSPQPSPRGHKYFGFVQKNNSSLKTIPPPQSPHGST